jgi:hypothetical protein
MRRVETLTNESQLHVRTGIRRLHVFSPQDLGRGRGDRDCGPPDRTGAGIRAAVGGDRFPRGDPDLAGKRGRGLIAAGAIFSDREKSQFPQKNQLTRADSWDAFFTCSKSWINFKVSSVRPAGSLESGMSAWNLVSTSLHSMPRREEPQGASTVLVNLAPDVVTMVTVAPQPQSQFGVHQSLHLLEPRGSRSRLLFLGAAAPLAAQRQSQNGDGD